MQRPLAGQNTEWFHCTMDVTGNSPNYQETSSRTPLKRGHGWSTSSFLKRDCIVLMKSTVYLCVCLCLSGDMSVLHVYIKLYYIIFCMLLYFDTLKNLSCWGERAPPFVAVQSLSYVWLWPRRLQHTRLPCPSPEFARVMSIESVMPSNHLILCCPLFLLPSILSSIRFFSKELALHFRWPKYWSFSFSISPSNEY